MKQTLDPHILRRLDTQGFDSVSEAELAPVASWLRLAYGFCAAFALIGTALASPAVLAVLAVIAALAALFPVHSFDLVYNLGIRHFTATGPLPRRGAPARFACGVGSLWLVATIAAFQFGLPVVGYGLGLALALVAALVSTTDICIPSMLFRLVVGPPKPRGVAEG